MVFESFKYEPFGFIRKGNKTDLENTIERLFAKIAKMKEKECGIIEIKKWQ